MKLKEVSWKSDGRCPISGEVTWGGRVYCFPQANKGCSLDDWQKWMDWITAKRRSAEMKTYTIELRVDIPEDEDKQEREQIIRQAARQAARTLLTTAALISQKRKPVIAVHSNDYFEGVKEVEILDDENNSAMEANHDGGTGSEVEEGTSATVEPA